MVGKSDRVSRRPLAAAAASLARAASMARVVRRGLAARAPRDADDPIGRLHLITERTAELILRLDPDFRCRYASAGSRDVIGFAPGDLLGHSLVRMVIDSDRHAYDLLQARLQRGEPTADAIFRCRRGTGGAVWLEARGRRLDTGMPDENEGFVLALRDIDHIMAHATRADRQLAEANRQLAHLNQVLETQALQDSMTGLANRRRFDRALDDEFRRAMRARSPLALVMIDVDQFKSYNDTYGHPGGDTCLRLVSDTIVAIMRRPADLVARYGGEEIAVLLPGTDTAGAATVAQRMVDAVRNRGLPHLSNQRQVVTISAGVAAVVPMKDFHTPTDLIWAADRALYAAKSGGRDCVRVGAELSQPPLRIVQ